MDFYTTDELIAWKPPQIQWIIKPLLPVAGKMMVFGLPKSWKSMLSYHTGFTISKGLPWFGFKTSKQAVALAQFEIGQAMVRERIAKYQAHANGSPGHDFRIATSLRFKMNTQYGFRELDQDIARLVPRPMLVILDPMYRCFAGNIADPKEISGFLDNIDTLIAKYNTAFIIIHHNRKTQNSNEGPIDRGAEEALGSSYIGNWVDSALSLRPKTLGSSEIVMRFELLRHAEEELHPMTIVFERATLQPRIIEQFRQAELEGFTNKDVSIRGLT